MSATCYVSHIEDRIKHRESLKNQTQLVEGRERGKRGERERGREGGGGREKEKEREGERMTKHKTIIDKNHVLKSLFSTFLESKSVLEGTPYSVQAAETQPPLPLQLQVHQLYHWVKEEAPVQMR